MTTDAKELIFEEEAREKLRQGVDLLANVAKVTLGPKGLNVGIEAKFGSPKFTNDGDSVVKEVESADQYVNMGAQLGQEVTAKMKERCGDGTTSTTILLQALVSEGVKRIASGCSPIFLKRGMDKAVDVIVDAIQKSATPIQSNDEIKNIATASASGNRFIGEEIANAFDKVGTGGVVSIEEGKKRDTEVEVVDGMRFDRGYLSPYFRTHTERFICELENPHILLTDKKISSPHDIIHLLQGVSASGGSLLIVADDIESDVISTLVINKLRGSLKVCAVKAPGFGDRRSAMLEDLAILTGGTYVANDQDVALKDIEIDQLGRAAQVTVTKDHTTIIEGGGEHSAIETRIGEILAHEDKAENKYDREKLAERRAKLSGGVAVIRVGAPTEAQMKQEKGLYEDSLNSTKAAIEEGIVAGGGLALFRAGKSLDTLKLEGDEAIGASIVRHALRAPLRQLIQNSGLDASLILQEIEDAKESIGFNALKEKTENLFEAGIVDPAKVIKQSLKIASSTAGVILLSEVLIGDASDE